MLGLFGVAHQFRQERLNPSGRTDHFIGSNELCVIVETDQLCQFVPPVQQLAQDFDILRISAIVVNRQHLLAQVIALCVIEEWEDVGILGRDLDLAVFIGLVRGNIIVRESIQVIDRIEFEITNVLANIAVPLLPYRDQFVVEFANALTRRFVLVYAGQAKAQQRLFNGESRGFVRVG